MKPKLRKSRLCSPRLKKIDILVNKKFRCDSLLLSDRLCDHDRSITQVRTEFEQIIVTIMRPRAIFVDKLVHLLKQCSGT
jgi:hypothetical protein